MGVEGEYRERRKYNKEKKSSTVKRVQWKPVKVNTLGPEKVLMLSEVDLFHIQRHNIVKY